MIEEAEIGKKIRKYRLIKKVTLQELAKETGFTKGYLSRIENTPKAPPVSTLIILSKALDISLSDIFGEKKERKSACLVKKGERTVVVQDGTLFGYAYEKLADKFTDKHMQPYVLTLPKRLKKNAVFQHTGEEMLFVLEGTMKFIHGENEYLVEQGDCIYFDASFPHYGACHGEKGVKCLMVIYTPE
jgi:transcriptional regulator with XRE-family HTH domain